MVSEGVWIIGMNEGGGLVAAKDFACTMWLAVVWCGRLLFKSLAVNSYFSVLSSCWQQRSFIPHGRF